MSMLINKKNLLGIKRFLAVSAVGCVLLAFTPFHVYAQSFPYCSPNDIYLNFQIYADGKEVSYTNPEIPKNTSNIMLQAKFNVKDGSRCRVDNLQAGFLNNTEFGVRDIGAKSSKIVLDSQLNKTKEYAQIVKLDAFQSLSNASVMNAAGQGFAVQAYGWFMDTDQYVRSTNLIIKVSASGGVTTSPSPTGSSGGGTGSVGGGTSPTVGGSVDSGSSWCGGGKGVLCNPLRSNTLGELMLVIMKGFILLVAAWAVLFIVIGGFRMVISQGNAESIKTAKATITWAIAGVIVSLLAYSLVAIVQNLIGYYGT